MAQSGSFVSVGPSLWNRLPPFFAPLFFLFLFLFLRLSHVLNVYLFLEQKRTKERLQGQIQGVQSGIGPIQFCHGLWPPSSEGKKLLDLIFPISVIILLRN